MPADFFRTMEDASGVDLDWFWRGWFYTTDHCDIGIESVRWLQSDKGDPDEQAERRKAADEKVTPSMSASRNAQLKKRIEQYPELKDFYNLVNPYEVTPENREAYQRFVTELSEDERKLLEQPHNYYEVQFRNHGGLVMPIILRLNYEDGSHEIVRVPAEIWRENAERVSKGFLSTKQLKSIELDPHRETADGNRENNHFPPKFEPSRFKLYKAVKIGHPIRCASNSNARRRAKRKPKQKRRRLKPSSDAPWSVNKHSRLVNVCSASSPTAGHARGCILRPSDYGN